MDRVIHNPRSKRAARGRAAVESQLRELEPSREIPWVTLDELAETPTDAESRVLVIGGDGTINAVANWVADLPAAVRPTIAIVPAGTGNNLARDLGYPIDPQCAVDAIRHSTRERTLDLIRIRDGVRGDAIDAIQSV
ncbi:MAG: acylglycerol kinase family protein, partial [Planctomycetes bacterium]|nr:acylglycerol kinase family protein [Planctomycetota bacterium]